MKAGLDVAMAILWFAWAGSYWGWNTWPVALVSLFLGAVAISHTAKRIPWAAWAIAGASLLPLALGGYPDSRIGGIAPLLFLPRALWWLAYGAAFVLVQEHLDEQQGVGRGMVAAGWVLFPLTIAGAWATPGGLELVLIHKNVLAALLVLLIPAGVATLTGRWRWVWAVVGGVAVGVTGSRAGLLGLAVGGLVSGQPAGIAAIAGALPAFVLVRGAELAPTVWAAMSAPGYATVNGLSLNRLDFARRAVQMWLSSPIVGHGPGAYLYLEPGGAFATFHAHCLPLTVAAETGLVGLAALGFLGWQMWRLRRWGHWAWAGVASIGVMCLVDEPVWFWGVGLGVASLLAVLARSAI